MVFVQLLLMMLPSLENKHLETFCQFSYICFIRSHILHWSVIQNIEGRIDTYEEYGLNTTIPLTVSRSVGFFGPITVTWQAEPREATILDFSPSSGTLSMADTQQSANIYITIIDDDVAENMEVSAQNFCILYCKQDSCVVENVQMGSKCHSFTCLKSSPLNQQVNI